MKRVVVIGADGFIGKKLAIELSNAGKQVLALVFNDSDTLQSIFKANHIVSQSFTFDNLLDIHVRDYDTVYHMAWAGVCSSSKNNSLEQSKNIIYGLKVMEWAKDNDIKRIIIPGSAAEVSCGIGMISGSEVPAPSDMYSACKVATRVVCQSYARLNQLDLIWTLITSVYGPGRNDNNLITYTITSLLQGRIPSFTKLEQQWDYIYIDDLIYALICIGELGKAGKVYPVGSGVYAQMRDYVYEIRDLIDPEMPLGIGQLPYKNKNIIDNQILDISSLKEDTGYNPRFSFQDGIKITIDYLRESL